MTLVLQALGVSEINAQQQMHCLKEIVVAGRVCAAYKKQSPADNVESPLL